MWGHWSWTYWHDEENKPKDKKNTSGYCDHTWVDKPLFNHIHIMCDKCGMLHSEWLNEKTTKKEGYYD